jgi:two-component system response regulator MprA
MDTAGIGSILLVEDDARSAGVLARMLREDGFDVDLVADGPAAIERLTRGPLPDVLVTDLWLPGADGFSVARYARSQSGGLPIILVTGYPNLSPDASGPLDPRPVVLAKPLDYAALNEEIRRALAGAEPADACSSATPSSAA